MRIGLVAALGAWVVLSPPEPQSAQQRLREAAVKVTGIASNGGTVTITADGPLTRAQTFQSAGWFHVVIVHGQTELGRSAPGGIRIQRISDSLEILIPIKSGASVTVHPRGDRLDLNIEGGVESRVERDIPRETALTEPARARRESRAPDAATEGIGREAERRSARTEQTAVGQAPTHKKQQVVEKPAAAAQSNMKSVSSAPSPLPATQSDDALAAPVTAVTNAPQNSEVSPVMAAPDAQANIDGAGNWGDIIFSMPVLLALLGGVLALIAYLVIRRRRGGAEADGNWVSEKTASRSEKKTGKAGRLESMASAASGLKPFVNFRGDRRKDSVPVPFERRKGGHGAEDLASRQVKFATTETAGNGHPSERRQETRTATVPSVLFGAYRIDQEVAQLVVGGPHSIEVLSSRAVDDRRAVETSLLKVLRAQETDEDGRRRARTALEDYGFVARQNATLLLASNAYERTSAARTLGEMISAQALPFLTEALYDGDAGVRTEAVKALGMLGLPSSIGALLDVARRHPDIPAMILSPALTACSVESLDTGSSLFEEGLTLAQAESAEQFVSEMRAIEHVKEVSQLPEWLEDQTLQEALDRLDNAGVETRIAATQSLAMFQVRRAVEALTAMAVSDEAAAVRAAAVTALGSIDHESVFAPVLIGMADESREVRAAAARTLSRLSFERADAYMHVAETADSPTLCAVARACINAGLATQAVNRLASDDRRQAYEAFSVLSLMVKGGEAQVILDAVESHQDTAVRMAAVHLLGLMDDPDLAARLQLIAERVALPAPVCAAILEVAGRVALARQEMMEA